MGKWDFWKWASVPNICLWLRSCSTWSEIPIRLISMQRQILNALVGTRGTVEHVLYCHAFLRSHYGMFPHISHTTMATMYIRGNKRACMEDAIFVSNVFVCITYITTTCSTVSMSGLFVCIGGRINQVGLLGLEHEHPQPVPNWMPPTITTLCK